MRNRLGRSGAARRSATPLTESYREGVLWHEAIGTEERALLSAPTESVLPGHVDVAVVGGGYCGLSAAAELARRGRSVVVLERHELGWGASSRNGGMVIPELKSGPATLEAAYGELGHRLHQEVQAAFDHVESVVADEQIDCDYARSGQLYLTHGRRGLTRLRSLERELLDAGTEARVVTGGQLREEAGSPLFSGGLLVDRTGGLHPAKFHAGLAGVARSCGASLHPHTPVLSRRPSARSGHSIRTPRGELHAKDVLFATNAYPDAVEPALQRRVLPMGSFIIATEPLAPDLAATVLPTRRMAFSDRNLLWYWRHGPDGRLLFGGRRSLGRVALPEARDHLYDSMLAAHPQLSGTRVERVWGGEVALTLDRLPHCGRRDGMWYAAGCNGSGVALNTWLGHRMAQAICGEPMPPFAELADRPIPLRALRRLWLPVVGSWFRLQDQLDR